MDKMCSTNRLGRMIERCGAGNDPRVSVLVRPTFGYHIRLCGISIVKQLPLPRVLSTLIFPLCAVTMVFT